jgi:hypothetical protein
LRTNLAQLGTTGALAAVPACQIPSTALYDAASSYTKPGGAIANRKTWTWQAAGDNTSRGSRR